MITTLIFFISLITCLIYLYQKEVKLKEEMPDRMAALTAMSCVGFVICVLMILTSHMNVDLAVNQNKIIQEAYRHEMILIKSDINYYNKIEKLDEIREWNLGVILKKNFANNLWTNWFFSQEIVDSLETIDMGRFK